MYQIRPYETCDWRAICCAHDRARKKELSLAGMEAAFLPLEVAAEREDLFGYHILVCLDGEVVAGFAAFTEEELAWLYVHPYHSRKGVGRALAQAALEQMGPGDKYVEVLARNTPALALYKSLGFTQERVVSGKMPGNETFSVTVHQLCRRDK